MTTPSAEPLGEEELEALAERAKAAADDEWTNWVAEYRAILISNRQSNTLRRGFTLWSEVGSAHIAAFSPPTALRLIGEIRRLRELERRVAENWEMTKRRIAEMHTADARGGGLRAMLRANAEEVLRCGGCQNRIAAEDVLALLDLIDCQRALLEDVQSVEACEVETRGYFLGGVQTPYCVRHAVWTTDGVCPQARLKEVLGDGD